MKLTAVLLTATLMTGCASFKRHPVFYGLAVGAGVGLAAGLVTKGVNCPQTMYEGKPYSGRSPGCPKDEPSKARLR